VIGALGLAVTIAGAGSALIGTYAAIRAVQGRGSIEAPVRAAWCAIVALAAANLIMVVALVARDFSIAYVAQVGSRETPLLFTVASLWGALEGSILFWAGLLAGVAVLLIRRTRDTDDRARVPGALAVLLALTAFFALIVVGPGNPWQRLSPVPLDGPGPNPLLQDHPLMAFHPPLLYLGFVGLAVPFALTVDALVRGRLDDGWLRLARRWTLGPWTLLTLGLVAGAWWSYAVLGWGGYWGWDPVENVALLPWLTATAFIHSAMVGRRGGLLLTWNVALVTASFALTLFATLVTRSGVLDSVHAFTRSAIGPLFVGLLGAVLMGMVGLLVLRLPDASGHGRLGARGQAFLVNNLLLAAVAATVLVGTVFPLLVEVVADTRVSVGAPYFERVVGPLAAGLLVLVGVGPSLPWGRWSPTARRALIPGAVSAAALAGALVALRLDATAVAGGAVGTFALTQSVWFIGRRLVRGERALTHSGARLSRVNTRAIGGLLSHVGFAVLALAVVASATGKRETVVALTVGGSAEALGRTIAFIGREERPGPNRTVIAARLRVGDGASAVELTPSLNVFLTSTQAIATPAIVPGAVDDLYITLLDLDAATGVATVRVGTHPFVSWIWPGGTLIALGGVLALAARPLARRSRIESTSEDGIRPVVASESALDVVGR
jgi:cytochrome c-type biogenesis protein CcmF